MGQVIILEGPDGGGKTTLANELVKLGFAYGHEGPPAPGVDLVAHYLRILDDALKSPQAVVLDRLWLGERIYGPLCRGVDRLGKRGQILFERIHDSKQIIQYVCIPKIDVARANYRKKMAESDDFLKSKELWEQVFTGYMKWIYNHGTMGTIYDYTEHNMTTIMCDLSIYGGQTRFPEGMIGSRIAKYLFIGDQPNHESIDQPFFALNGSSGYLNEALVHAGIREKDLALGNAYGPKDTKHSLVDMVNALPRLEKIVLMGKAAEGWYDLRSHQIVSPTVIRIPHPSWFKRFKGHNPQIMAEVVREKLNGVASSTL